MTSPMMTKIFCEDVNSYFVHTCKISFRNSNPIKSCGNKTFDIKKQICCDVFVQERSTKSDRCCGRRSYNPETHMCCADDKPFRDISD